MSDHCWHSTGGGISHGFGGHDNMVCCRCGTSGMRGYSEVAESVSGHGPHFSRRRVVYDEVRALAVDCSAPQGITITTTNSEQ